MVRPLVVVFLLSSPPSGLSSSYSSSSNPCYCQVLQLSEVQSPSSFAYPLSVKAGWLDSQLAGLLRLGITEWDGDRVSYFHYPPHFPSGSSIAPFFFFFFPSTALLLLAATADGRCSHCCSYYCWLLHSLAIPANGLDHALPRQRATWTNYSLLVLFGLWVSFRKHPERPSGCPHSRKTSCHCSGPCQRLI